MGMYPPGEGDIREIPESLVADLGPANPPFNVRDTKAIAEELGYCPLPQGFAAIPVMNYGVPNTNDFKVETFCRSIKEAHYAKYFSTYSEYESEFEPIRKPLRIALNLPEEFV